MANNTTGTSCLGPLAGMEAQQRLYQETGREAAADSLSSDIAIAMIDSEHLDIGSLARNHCERGIFIWFRGGAAC